MGETCLGQAKTGRRATARQLRPTDCQEVASLDKMLWGITTFQQANRNKFNVPFSELMRKHAKVDPVEAAARLRGRRQEPKK
ncbi:MAG: hypothetical protein K0R39_3707 [Symbiobacteriaceae bacterium]|nr:hypothetical protein [Symbiobacteriaceae bacterium]